MQNQFTACRLHSADKIEAERNGRTSQVSMYAASDVIDVNYKLIMISIEKVQRLHLMI